MTAFGFNENDAKRIGKVVRLVEREPVRRDLGQPDYGNRSPGVRMMVGKIAGSAWSKGSGKTVTIWTGAPGSEASAATVSAWNYFADIATSANTARWVGVSNNGWGWVLIAAECDAEEEE